MGRGGVFRLKGLEKEREYFFNFPFIVPWHQDGLQIKKAKISMNFVLINSLRFVYHLVAPSHPHLLFCSL